MKKSISVPLKETSFIALGELIVSRLTVGVFLLLNIFIENIFDYTVITGVILGSLVIILNFLFMSIAVNRAIDEAFTFRGDYKDDPEDTAEPSEALPLTDGGESKENIEDTDEPTDEAEDEPIVEDAAMRFARDHAAKVQRVSKVAYIIRTVSVLLALVLALITGVFDPIATVVPMLMLRPIVMVEGLLRQPG